MTDLANNPDSSGGKYQLINAYESIVKTNVQELMKDEDMCKCEKCFLDVCALVLNSKHASYSRFVTTKKGALLAQIPEMGYVNKTEMTVIILDAIRQVKESPQHEN